METGIDKKKTLRRRLFYLISIIGLILISYYSIMLMMSPGRKMQMIKEEFKPANKSENAANENIYEDSLYLSLLKEKSFMQSKIAMAGTDSIYLTLNLPDSTINIEISGVLVHSAKMSKYKYKHDTGKRERKYNTKYAGFSFYNIKEILNHQERSC